MLLSHKPMEPQRFKELSHLALSYDDIKVLVVPASGIFNEELLDNREILDVYSQLGCFVPITQKMTVNGKGRPPVLKYLFECSVFGDHNLPQPWWGFLVDKEGHVRAFFNTTKGEWLARLAQDIETM